MDKLGSPNDEVENVLPAPPRILQLPEEVVNRIAAGEVVVSPAAALKELLENSIDAGATSITVAVRGGGAKLLQVIDNGRGIRPDDLPLLCERHATSKLRAFDDLASVSTFGFRGEALASVSHVARVSVLTKTAEAKCAHAARYVDGVLAAPPAPVAGLDGTALSVEDLFYNLPTRRRALRSASEEYRGIVDVVARYAIRYSHVAFACKRLPDGAGRASTGTLDVRTAAGARSEDNIRAAFGANLALELVQFEARLELYGIGVSAYATNPGFSMRKGLFVLFINGRLVNCGPLKRAVDATYATFLPKGGHSFCYLDITVPSSDVDVNVHPNKMEIRFLHEAELVEAVVDSLQERLKSDGKSRTFLAQALIAPSGELTLPKRPAEVVGKLAEPSGNPGRPQSAKPTFFSRGGAAEEVPARLEADMEETENLTGTRSVKRRRRVSLSLVDNEADAHADSDDAVELDADADQDVDMADFINDDDEDGSGEDADVGEMPQPPDEPESIPEENAENGVLSSPSSPEAAPWPASPAPAPAPGPTQKVASKDKVRNSRVAPVGAMDAYLLHGGKPSVATDLRRRRQRRRDALPMLTSIQELIDDLRSNVHRGAQDILRQHTFVGVASEKYALIQYQTKLMLVDIVPVVTALMYRQALMRFADLESIKLNPPAPLMALLALTEEDSCESAAPPAPAPSRAAACAQLLVTHSALLNEYFSIEIAGDSADQAKVVRLPILFAGITPDLASLPEFLVSLLDVNWAEEQPCLGGIAKCIANWFGACWAPEVGTYCSQGPSGAPEEDAAPAPSNSPLPSLEERKEWLLKHVLFESMRFEFDPPTTLACALRELVSTAKLYKIFERC
jgi:DNA mismatch repair protein MLH1